MKEGRALQMTAGPYRWRPGPAGDDRAPQVTTGPCRSCAGRQGPAVTLLDGRLFHMTDGPALRCETPARDARDCRPVGTYRAPGTLGITGTESNTTDPIGQAPLPPSAQHGEEHVAETQLRDDHPDTNTADLIRQPTPPLADSNTPEGVPDREGSIPNSTDSTIPSTEPPSPPRPRPWPSKFWHSLRKIATRPKTLRQPSRSRSTGFWPSPLSFVF